MAITEFTAAPPPAVFDWCIPAPRPPVTTPAISACCQSIPNASVLITIRLIKEKRKVHNKAAVSNHHIENLVAFQSKNTQTFVNSMKAPKIYMQINN